MEIFTAKLDPGAKALSGRFDRELSKLIERYLGAGEDLSPGQQAAAVAPHLLWQAALVAASCCADAGAALDVGAFAAAARENAEGARAVMFRITNSLKGAGNA
jgi:hypothetical protein